MVNRYEQGRRFEHRTRKHLEANGYEVFRTAGSKTKVDLSAVKPGQLLFIQCKRSGALPPGEWNKLMDLAEMVGALPLLATRTGRGRLVYERLTLRKTDRSRVARSEPFLLDEVVGE